MFHITINGGKKKQNKKVLPGNFLDKATESPFLGFITCMMHNSCNALGSKLNQELCRRITENKGE